jgi:hypothetical protein
MKNRNRREGKKIAVMAAIIMGFMVIAFMPLASAGVTSFTVTPNTGLAGSVVDSYNALVTTDGVTSINITIPAGFIAVEPLAGGKEIARVEFWNTSKGDYYGYATITSNNDNPTTQVDVYAKMQVGGDEFEYGPTPQEVDYTPGGVNSFEVKVNDGSAWANITLPKETDKGSINITTDCESLDLLQDVHIAIKKFVRNPKVAGWHHFYADGKDATVHITALIGCGAVFRDGKWFIDTDGDHVADRSFWYGTAGDIPMVGDINQYAGGQDDTIIFKNGKWYVDTNGDHVADESFWYGIANDDPVVGDINQDGKDDTIIFRNGKWYVDTDYNHVSDENFWYGIANDDPVVGDINQDGKDDTIIFRNGKWYVDTDYNHVDDESFWYGIAGDVPLVADINQDGLDDTVIFRNGKWYVDTDYDHVSDLCYWYGIAGDDPVGGPF